MTKTLEGRKKAVYGVVMAVAVASLCRADDRSTGTVPSNPLQGNWAATLKLPTGDLRIGVKIGGQPDALNGTLNSVDQDGQEHPFDAVTLKGNKVRLVLKISRIVYEGQLNSIGTEIVGDLKQNGGKLPLTFKKVDEPLESRKRPQSPKRPFPYQEEEVRFENKSAAAKFAGALTIPRTAGKHPAVLLVTGSGPQDRDETIAGHKPFLVLADYLTRRGIAVLRVDDRGVGGSTGNAANATTADLAEDAIAAIDYLKTRPEIDSTKIGIMGHSEGGMIAPMLAAKSSSLAFIVLLAAPALPGEQISYLQMESLLKQIGAPDSLIERTHAFQQKVFAASKEEANEAAFVKRARKVFDEYRASLSPEEKKMSGVAVNASDTGLKLLHSPWIRFFLTYDPRSTLRQVHCPVLALVGAKDTQVDAKVNAPELEKALREAGNKDFTVQVLPKLNHLFQTCKTGSVSEYGQIDETFAPSALKIIGDWIAKHVGLDAEK